MNGMHTQNPHTIGQSAFFSPDICLVGTLGDYEPGTTYEEKFPEMNEVNTNYPSCTYLTNSQPGDNTSQTVKYSFDTRAYYRLVAIRPDLDIIKVDGSEVAEHDEETKGEILQVNIDDDDDDGGSGPNPTPDKDDLDGVYFEWKLVEIRDTPYIHIIVYMDVGGCYVCGEILEEGGNHAYSKDKERKRGVLSCHQPGY